MIIIPDEFKIDKESKQIETEPLSIEKFEELCERVSAFTMPVYTHSQIPLSGEQIMSLKDECFKSVQDELIREYRDNLPKLILLPMNLFYKAIDELLVENKNLNQ